MTSTKWQRWLAIVVLLTLGSAGAGLAQEETGNIYGKVTDTGGAGLPGVSVEITGPGAPRQQLTDVQGNFRFLSLDPGLYALVAQLDGFSTVEYDNVTVNIGRNTQLEVQLSSAVEDVITVTTESPLLDERRLSSGTQISQVELEKIPTARDPWSLLNQAPGVLVDRINVGGNESGQQSNFRGQAVNGDQNAFLVDGVEITDMSAVGSSATYYDFDQFNEMQFTTGGTDVTKVTAGVSVNLVTKRGTNDFRGSARYLVTDPDGYLGVLEQADADFNPSDLGPTQTTFTAPSINRIEDIGFEAGGPLKQDRIWLWGSWGQNDIKQFASGGTADDTILENTALKLNAQIASNNSFVGSWNNGDKQKFGRGASTTRPPATTWNQRGPTAIWKFEDTHVVNSNFFLSGQLSKVDGGFSLNSRGGTGPSGPETLWDENGVWQNSYVSGSSSRPSEEYHLDGSYFFNAGNTNHELKFGGRLREFERESPFGWAGRNIVHIAGQNFGNPAGPNDFFFLYRRGRAPSDTEYTSFWAQDTVTAGNFTINAGFRWDMQEGSNIASSVDANVAAPDVLPAINFEGNDGGGFDWNTISPRIGVTYALGEERKTLLRGSLSSFPSQLSAGDITRTNPLGASYAYFSFTDQNGDNIWQAEEPNTFLFGSGFDPANPTAVSSPNITDSGLDPEITRELILGVEHALLPEFMIGLNVTARNTSDVLDVVQLVRDESGIARPMDAVADFVPDTPVTGTLPDGTAYNVPTFALRPGVSLTGGTLYTNGDREIDSLFTSLTFTKRLANRWMLRGFVSVGEGEWDVPASFLATDDPNDEVLTFSTPTTASSEDNDGDIFVAREGGSGKGDVFLQSGWQYNLAGMYQVAPDAPWGFNVSANIYGREGYPIPLFHSFTGADGINRGIQVTTDVDQFRTDDILTVDLRLEKEFRTAGNTSLTFSLDGFNMTDEDFVLQRNRSTTTNAGNLAEILSPRIYRLGVRLNWR